MPLISLQESMLSTKNDDTSLVPNELHQYSQTITE